MKRGIDSNSKGKSVVTETNCFHVGTNLGIDVDETQGYVCLREPTSFYG